MKIFANLKLKSEPRITLPRNYDELSAHQRKITREWYAQEQGGLCYFCKEELSEDPPESIQSRPVDLSLFPKGFLNHPIHLQHNHRTGMTEGAVHARCNAIMWEYHGI